MAEVIPRAMSVVCTDDELRVYLTDGRRVSVPIAWFPRLAHATAAERANFELLGDGQGIQDALNKLSLRGAKRRGNPEMSGETKYWIASLRSQ